MRFASHPEKFVCIAYDNEGVTRILVRGQYLAWFSTSVEEGSGECYAGVAIVDFEEWLNNGEEPKVVLLDRLEQNIDSADWSQCGALLHDGDPPECDWWPEPEE